MAFLIPVVAAIASAASSAGGALASGAGALASGIGGAAGGAGAGAAGAAAPAAAGAGGALAGGAAPAAGGAAGSLLAPAGTSMAAAPGALSALPTSAAASGAPAAVGAAGAPAAGSGGFMGALQGAGKNALYPMLTGQSWEGGAAGQSANPLTKIFGNLGNMQKMLDPMGLMGGKDMPPPTMMQGMMQGGMTPTPFQPRGFSSLPGAVQPPQKQDGGMKRPKTFSDYMMYS